MKENKSAVIEWLRNVSWYDLEIIKLNNWYKKMNEELHFNRHTNKTRV